MSHMFGNTPGSRQYYRNVAV